MHEDLILIDDAVLLLLYVSPAGSNDKLLIGCRQVSHFEPLNIVVLNTTVIFQCYRGQKNLDPVQQLTARYIAKEYPRATRVGVVIDPELKPVNWHNYTTNGFPWPTGPATFRKLDMVNIDAPSYSSGVHDAGAKADWDVWQDGHTKWVYVNRKKKQGYYKPLRGGYGQHGFTLIAMIPVCHVTVRFEGPGMPANVFDMKDTVTGQDVAAVASQACMDTLCPEQPVLTVGDETLLPSATLREFMSTHDHSPERQLVISVVAPPTEGHSMEEA